MDHLETKRQILALRKKFGENDWLSNRAGTAIQTIMGIENTVDVVPSPSPILSIQILDSAQNSNEDKTSDSSDNKSVSDETVNDENVKETRSVSLEVAIIESHQKAREPEPVYNPEEGKTQRKVFFLLM